MCKINEDEIAQLLSHTESLLKHIYWVRQKLTVKPDKEHTTTSINFNDINERRVDFLRELINTIVAWVYGQARQRKLFDERVAKANGDYGNASTFLATQAFSKFRPGHPQGQFGELLLFNFIQFFFSAVPLLRKQRITTSVGHERYGADAIHYRKDGNNNIFILGESKCYRSKYQFKNAFATSLESIVSTFNRMDEELSLYIYDDFIEPELEGIAKAYKSGALKNIHFELVCLVAYNETINIAGENEEEIKSSIMSIVQERCKSIEEDIYESTDDRILKRLNYIIFPIWRLDSLLDKFQRIIGTEQ